MSTKPTSEPDSQSSIDVLHVDDEPSFAEMAGTFLERHDDRFSVEPATSASEGLEYLAREDVDCVVSDYDMPGQNGIDLLEAVREDRPDLPFVLYTGKGSEEIASDAISAGVTDYLQKESGTSQYAVLANRVTNAVEQYRSRRAVEETERKLTQLAEKTDDVLFMFDGDWSELLFVNSAYEDIWGGSIDELGENPESFLELVHPQDREIAVESMERLASGEPDEVEYRIVRPDGETRWVRGDSKPIVDADGTVSRIVGYVQDVTERKERERELRRRERRYQAVFNDPNILVGLIDTDGTVLEINETAMDYVDASREDLAGEPFWETPWFTHSASLQEEVRSWIDQAADGEYVEFEADLRRPDGEPYTIQGVFRPVTDDDGEVVSLLISDRDISELKEHERELERTTALLSTLFETLPVGVLAEDAARDVLAVNERLFELFDLPGTPASVVGADCAALAEQVGDTFADPAGFVDRIDELVAAREPVYGEELALANGGTYGRSYVPIDLPDGDGHLWVYREMT